MAKPSSFHSINDILGKLLDQNKWHPKIAQYSFFNHWEEIVGPKIAAHATPTLWQGEVLQVTVSHSTWLQELRMMEEDIITKIRKYSPEIQIKKIHWKISSTL